MAESRTPHQPDNQQRSVEDAIRLLLTGGERWGWAATEPSRLRQEFSAPEPVPPTPFSQIRASKRRIHSTGPARVLGVRASRLLLTGFVIAIVLGIIEAAVGQPQSTGSGLEVGASLLIWALWIPAIVSLWRRYRPSSGHWADFFRERARERAHRAANAEWESAKREWARAKDAHEVQESYRLAQVPLYESVRFTGTPGRVDVFGDQAAWPALLVTLGGSILGSRIPLRVLDFSDADASSRLQALCAESGIPVRTRRLPEDGPHWNALSGWTPVDIIDVVVESLYAGSDPMVVEQRSVAHRLLDEVAEALAPNVTMSRLWRGVRVALGYEQTAGSGPELDASEWHRVDHLFARDHRDELRRQLARLEPHLHALRLLGGPESDNLSEPQLLECSVVTGRRGSLEQELWRDFVVERTLHGLAREFETGSHPVLIIAGADRLSPIRLKKADQRATANGCRMVLLFSELSAELTSFAGSGGAVAFLRLSNASQAERAADWIGRDHRFVLGALTEERARLRVHSESDNVSFSKTQQRSGQGGVGVTLAPTPSLSLTGGGAEATHQALTRTRVSLSLDSNSERLSTTTQRVYEHVVDAPTLRGLPPNTLLLAEVQPGGFRRIVAADCTPELALDSRVSP